MAYDLSDQAVEDRRISACLGPGDRPKPEDRISELKASIDKYVSGAEEPTPEKHSLTWRKRSTSWPTTSWSLIDDSRESRNITSRVDYGGLDAISGK